jgi:hypothetical protein
MAGLARRFRFLIPAEELRAVLRRFPVSAFFSLALFILFLSGVDAEPDKTIYGRMLIAFVFGFFWFGIVDLLVESGRWSGKRKIAVSVSVYVVFVLLILFLHGSSLAFFLRNMMIALLLGVALAPYWRSKDDLSFWFFNYKLWSGVAISVAAGILWALGLCAILAAVHYLFGINVGLYKYVWIFAATMFTPLYALSWVPKQFTFREEDCHSPPQLSFLTNGILVPLLLVYLLILYAYFVKIAIVGELPRGQLVYMIAGFGVIGSATFMSGWPLREGARLTRDFYSVFFPALAIPALIQLYSIFLRIHQYGVTEDRYMVVLCAVWLLTLSIAYTLAHIRKTPIGIKLIPVSLIVLLVVSSAGPWGASSVSTRSQYARLEKILTAHNILQDGKIVPAAGEVPFGDRQSISGAVQYLLNKKDTKKLQEWFGTEWPLGAQGRQPAPFEIAAKMNIVFVSSYMKEEGQQTLNLNAKNRKELMDVRGYDYVLNDNFFVGQLVNHEGRVGNPSIGAPGVKAKLEGNNLTIILEDQSVMFDLLPLVQREAKEGPEDHADMVLEATSGNKKVKLHFQNINILQTGDIYEVNTVNFRLLLGQK